MSKVYPKEVFNSIRSYKNGETKTFSIETLFARGNEASPLSPPNYSSLKLSIFGKEGGVNGKIRETEIEAIYVASIACINNHFGSNTNNADKQVPFFAGKFKGKTPAQVINETNDLELLREQKKFLKENLERFPKNKELIDAINEAAIAYKNGTLKTDGGSATIYHSDSRHVGEPDANGNKKIYGIEIAFFNGKFSVSITNYKAPVIKYENGSTIVKASESVDKKVYSFDLEWDEWINAISICKRTADAYNNYMFTNTWEKATRLEEEERATWLNNVQNN